MIQTVSLCECVYGILTHTRHCDVGEEIVEPEVDLSSFLERQRLTDKPPIVAQPVDDEDDIDTSLAQYTAGLNSTLPSSSKKGKVQQIEWDASLESLSREKASADASRGKGPP